MTQYWEEPLDEAQRFVREWEPRQPEEAYEWVEEFAKYRLNVSDGIVAAQRSSAQFFMKYMGGAAAAAAGVFPIVFEKNLEITLGFLPFILGLAICSALACWSLRSGFVGGLPSIRQALEFANAYDRYSRIYHFAFSHVAEECRKRLVRRKAACLDASLEFFLFSICWVAVALGHLVIRPHLGSEGLPRTCAHPASLVPVGLLALLILGIRARRSLRAPVPTPQEIAQAPASPAPK
jgi:hypothetical protein